MKTLSDYFGKYPLLKYAVIGICGLIGLKISFIILTAFSGLGLLIVLFLLNL